MAATVLIMRITSTNTETDITSPAAATRMSQSDLPNPGAANPVPAPASGTAYSYWVSTRLKATVAPANGIDTLQWYSDGTSAGTGLTIKGQTASSYVQATSATLVLNTTNYASLTAATVDVTTLTAGSPKSVTGSIAASTGLFGHLFAYQLEVGPTAAPGPMSPRTFTWSFSET